jgi:hypothetical protein
MHFEFDLKQTVAYLDFPIIVKLTNYTNRSLDRALISQSRMPFRGARKDRMYIQWSCNESFSNCWNAD